MVSEVKIMVENISSVLRFIEHNIHERHDLESLAAIACLSPIHFHRTFKNTTGFTPRYFVEVQKIKRGLELLKDSDALIGDIAFELGFSNYETFTRAFTRHCQIAPAELQYILSTVRAQVGENTPVALSTLALQKNLKQLVAEALDNQTLKIDDLNKLQVCVISKNNNSWRPGGKREKYHISFHDDLALNISEILHQERNENI